MDNISNYFQFSPEINAETKEEVAEIQGLKAKTLQKIKEITDPIGEGFMIESAKNLVKAGVKTGVKATTGLIKNTRMFHHLKTMGFDENDAERYVSTFRKGGFKGLLNTFEKDYRGGKFKTLSNLERQEPAVNIEKITE